MSWVWGQIRCKAGFVLAAQSCKSGHQVSLQQDTSMSPQTERELRRLSTGKKGKLGDLGLQI